MNNILNAVSKLERYIESENYKGYDPYDGLSSPLFRLPVLKSNNKIKLYSQQFIKRFPLNIRPLLFIPKGYNPVTLGLCIQAYTYLAKTDSEKRDRYLTKINALIKELENLKSNEYSGACWGYDFDWQSSTVSIPAYGPTVVATGIITNALFQYYKSTGSETAKELILSSADFIMKDLKRTGSEESFCFSYSPFDNQQVYNANMKGVRLLAQVYSLSRNEKFSEAAKKAVQFVIENQNSDGSWYYSKRSRDNRIDNYHTGYILDCMKEYINLTGDSSIQDSLDKGFEFYINNFIKDGCIPKFYHDKTFPVDCTSAAQNIITLCNFGETIIAEKVADYMIKNMQSGKGYFYFRKYKYITNRTFFMRWSNAWMFLALSYLISKADN